MVVPSLLQVQLNVTVQWSVPPLGGEASKASRAVVAAWVAAEEAKRQTAAAKNDLESYIIKMTERVQDEEGKLAKVRIALVLRSRRLAERRAGAGGRGGQGEREWGASLSDWGRGQGRCTVLGQGRGRQAVRRRAVGAVPMASRGRSVAQRALQRFQRLSQQSTRGSV